MTVEDIIRARGIEEVVHFTSNHGFVGCLGVNKLLSRRRLPEEDVLIHVIARTSPVIFESAEWFDKSEDWLDFVNLSISELNSHYFRFASERWHTNNDRYWILMSFDPVIMGHGGVYFSTTNNVYEHTRRGKGAEGLEALFAPVIRRKGASWKAVRTNGRADRLPTCEQAEVLYPVAVTMDYLRKVYVREGDHADFVEMALKQFKRQDVQVIVSEKKFAGQP